jgi:hypothetical protein
LAGKRIIGHLAFFISHFPFELRRYRYLPVNNDRDLKMENEKWKMTDDQ